MAVVVGVLVGVVVFFFIKQYERGVFVRLGHVVPSGPGCPDRSRSSTCSDACRCGSSRCRSSRRASSPATTSASTSRPSPTSASSTRQVGGRHRERRAAINQIAQTTLRKVVGQHTLDETLAETDRINLSIREILDVATEDWGVVVTLVELKDIQLPDSMKRAMARQAEAEREKRAKIIAAEGEALAAGRWQASPTS